MTTYTATSIRALRAEFLDGEPAELVVADALSAYADLLEQREWRPIEDAPRDGTTGEHPCEACAEKNAEIARLRRTLEKQRGALNQASFCLRELLPDDYDAKFTVGIINSALALVPNA